MPDRKPHAQNVKCADITCDSKLILCDRLDGVFCIAYYVRICVCLFINTSRSAKSD